MTTTTTRATCPESDDLQLERRCIATEAIDDDEMPEDPDSDDRFRPRCGCFSCCCCQGRRRHLPRGRRRPKNECLIFLARLCLIVPNAVFVVVGLCVVGFGVWIRLDRDALLHLELLRHLPTVGPIVALERFPVVVISVGCSVVFLSLIGCCGACAENVSCLCVYTCLLFVILSAEIVLVITGVVMNERILASLGDSMKQEIILNYNTSLFDSTTASSEDQTFSNYFSKSWDSVQNKFNCCGSFGPGDYELSAWVNRSRLFYRETVVPASCCYSTNNNRSDVSSVMIHVLWDCQKDARHYLYSKTSSELTRKINVKTMGCHKFMFEATERTVFIAVGVFCSVVVLQIVNFIVGCVLLREERRQQEDMWLGSEDIAT